MNKLTIREIWTDNERLIEEEKATDDQITANFPPHRFSFGVSSQQHIRNHTSRSSIQSPSRGVKAASLNHGLGLIDYP